jgi:hypothetical protein
MTISRMTFSVMTISEMTLCRITQNHIHKRLFIKAALNRMIFIIWRMIIMVHSIKTLCIMQLYIRALSIRTLSRG